MLTVDPSILKKASLSVMMLFSLEYAFQKHKRGLPFGLRELTGSKTPLINRELIEFKSIYKNRHVVTTWKITKKGLGLMHFLNQNNLNVNIDMEKQNSKFKTFSFKS